MKAEIFAKLEVFHKLLYPLNEVTKFFERDDVTLCYVYPMLRCLKIYIRDEIGATTDDAYGSACHTILDSLKMRRQRHLDQALMKAAFWLTSFGAHHLSNASAPLLDKFLPRLHYQSPRRPAGTFGPLARFAAPVISPERPVVSEEGPVASEGRPVGDDVETRPDDETCEFVGAADENLSVDDPHRVQGANKEVLTFLIHFLTNLIEISPHYEPPNGFNGAPLTIEEHVSELVSFFFCNADWISRSGKVAPSIDRQVELWNFLALDTPECRKFAPLVETILTIITIPASEASCERSLSRQKRIMGHQRARTHPELLMAMIIKWVKKVGHRYFSGSTRRVNL
jgi:hypothetical protein